MWDLGREQARSGDPGLTTKICLFSCCYRAVYPLCYMLCQDIDGSRIDPALVLGEHSLSPRARLWLGLREPTPLYKVTSSCGLGGDKPCSEVWVKYPSCPLTFYPRTTQFTFPPRASCHPCWFWHFCVPGKVAKGQNLELVSAPPVCELEGPPHSIWLWSTHPPLTSLGEWSGAPFGR